MAITKRAPQDAVLTVPKVRQQTIELRVLGTTPLILHRLADKALHELLLPGPRKTAADKAATVKHDPIAEFRSAAITVKGGPTLLAVLSTAFKGAMMTAALDLPGVSKAQVGRLIYVQGTHVGIYGKPYLSMAVTRNSDPAHTPDIRTRPMLPRWAAIVRITYTLPQINQQSVVNLLSAAGVTAGVGDWRVEKGRGNYGMYSLVGPDDAEFEAVLAEGRDVQLEAMAAAEPYDDESAEMLEWYAGEIERRGRLHEVTQAA